MATPKVAQTPTTYKRPYKAPAHAVLAPTAPLKRSQPLAKQKKTAAQKQWEAEERKEKAERWEKMFEQQLQAEHMPPHEHDKLFLDGFMYRGDFFWRADKFCVEIDGGLGINQMSKRGQEKWIRDYGLAVMAGAEPPKLPTQGGHHNSPEGYEHDRIRDIEAFLQGWTTIRLTPNMVKDGTGISYVVRCYHAHCQRNSNNKKRSA